MMTEKSPTSLRAERSNPYRGITDRWIASSLCSLAQTLRVCRRQWRRGWRLRRHLQPLQRFLQFRLARYRRLALFLFFLHDLFGRVRHEFLVAEFGVDALDVGIGLDDFLVEPGLFGREVDHALERQRHHLAAHQQLHR